MNYHDKKNRERLLKAALEAIDKIVEGDDADIFIEIYEELEKVLAETEAASV